MPSRRRRRERRPADHPEPPRPTSKRPDGRRRAEFEARMAQIRRQRTIVGLLGFVPLAVSILPIAPLNAVPREVYLFVWAAIFGSFIGLSVRMWRERRAFERASSAT